MELDQKSKIARVVLIIVCLCIAITCYIQMNKSYDELARYQYVTEENREIILEYLDSDDINYMIDQQIKPSQFMDFITIEGFDIHNTLKYSMAKKTRDAKNDFIVNFVNRFNSNFKVKTLGNLLKYYSYDDLTTFYETEVVLNEDLSLISDLSNPYILLGENKTIYRYEPELVHYSNVYIVKEMKEDLKEMRSAYKKEMGHPLLLETGYQNYDSLITTYTQYQEYLLEDMNFYVRPAGQNELQLGYVIGIKGTREWLTMIIKKSLNTDPEEEIEDKTNHRLVEWLDENAYRYGFVIRYPKGKEDETEHVYQPFMLRYVGKKTAKTMHDSNLCMEEMEFSDKLN